MAELTQLATEYQALLAKLTATPTWDEDARRNLTNAIRENQRKATALFAVKNV